MPFPKCKVYSDGSHFIGIPHTTRPYRPRREPHDELITIDDGVFSELENTPSEPYEALDEEYIDLPEETPQDDAGAVGTARRITRREYFDELYEKTVDMARSKRRDFLIKALLPYFLNIDKAQHYVEIQMERKMRNLVSRRVRVNRKVNLNEFNYFCTFTYDGKKHTEEEFREKLRQCFSTFSKRRGWKYIGVWERSPKKKRLHFHGLFFIPEGTMPGKMIEVSDFSITTHRRQTTVQNTYFNERFGRSDFQMLDPESTAAAVRYILKYLEKSGERIVFSKGLPDHFISDIMDDDVVCRYGVDDRKLLLRDDFKCFRDGEYIGTVDRTVIDRLNDKSDMA